MSYNLFLDDERKPKDVKWVMLPLVEWTIARNYEQFVDIVTRLGLPLRVSFDHDLADEHYPVFEKNPHPTKIPYDKYKEKTGFHCAKWLVYYCMENELPLPECYIHTLNPIGRENIRGLLDSFLKSQKSS